MENIKIKLNIKSFMIFEKIAKKPFNRINYKDASDLSKLIYSSFIANNNYRITYESFIELLNNKKISKNINDSLQSEINYMQQFNSNSHSEYNNAYSESQDEYYIRDVVPILTMNCNLDINFVLYDLDVEDIQTYLGVYNSQKKDKLEMQRLWCYYVMLPHIDSKKLKSPKDLIKFNWEKDNEDSKEILEEWNTDKLDDILNKQIQLTHGK